MSDELLPCPFCGSSEHLFTAPDEFGSGGQWVSPIHAGCSARSGCGVSVIGDDEAEAIAAWNRRPSSQPLMGDREKAKERAWDQYTDTTSRGAFVAGYDYALASLPAQVGEQTSPAEAAYGALWRCITADKGIHGIRRHLLGLIGGQGSDGQRRGVAWAVANMPETTEAEIMLVVLEQEAV